MLERWQQHSGTIGVRDLRWQQPYHPCDVLLGCLQMVMGWNQILLPLTFSCQSGSHLELAGTVVLWLMMKICSSSDNGVNRRLTQEWTVPDSWAISCSHLHNNYHQKKIGGNIQQLQGKTWTGGPCVVATLWYPATHLPLLGSCHHYVTFYFCSDKYNAP